MQPVSPSVGEGVLHLFCSLGPDVDGEAVVAAVKAAQADGHQVVAFAVLGHKADLGFMALGPDLWRLRQLQAQLQAAGVSLTDSFVSLTETSEYAKGMPPEMIEPRLHPRLPPEGMRAYCFYPMSKRRNVGQNWYEQPYEERRRLMIEHGTSGRNFRGRVVQVVTGCTGLDDWEWGVSLFGRTPDDIKDCVYTLRFDEASATYAEFGSFVTGLVGDIEELLAELTAG